MPQFIAAFLIVVIWLFLIVYVIVPVSIVAIVVGVLIGSGHAIYNYGISFKNNVKPS